MVVLHSKVRVGFGLGATAPQAPATLREGALPAQRRQPGKVARRNDRAPKFY